MGVRPEDALAEVRPAMAAWPRVAEAENLPIPEPHDRPAIDALGQSQAQLHGPLFRRSQRV